MNPNDPNSPTRPTERLDPHDLKEPAVSAALGDDASEPTQVRVPEESAVGPAAFEPKLAELAREITGPVRPKEPTGPVALDDGADRPIASPGGMGAMAPIHPPSVRLVPPMGPAGSALVRHPLVLLAVGIVLGALASFAVGRRLSATYAARQARDAFTFHLVQLGERQLFWLHAYISRTELGLAKEDLDFAWSRYSEAKEAWTTDVLPPLVTRYLSPEQRKEFGEQVQPGLVELHRSVANLRYKKDPTNLTRVRGDLDKMASTLGHFTDGIDLAFPH